MTPSDEINRDALPLPRRVLFVLDHFYPHLGGGETLFWELSRTMAAQGTQVCVVTSRMPGTPRREVVGGVEIVRVWTPAFAARVWFAFLAIPVVWRLAREADLIHAAVYCAAIPAWLAARLRRKPLLLTVYEVFGEQWRQLKSMGWLAGRACELFELAVLRLSAARYVSISAFTKGRLVRFAGTDPEKISVVYCAVDYEFWTSRRHRARPIRQQHGWRDSTFVYLFFGRPGVSKGAENLVEAAAEVRRRLPGSRLVLLLGREPAAGRRRVERLIRTHRLEDHVLLLDPVPRDELPGYLLAADCVVVPSISEGFGYSAVEARALGCRVLATSGHAVQEVLDGEVELCPPGDAPAMAETIVRIAHTPKPVPPHVRKYDLPKHLREMLLVYGVTVGPRAAGRPGDASYEV